MQNQQIVERVSRLEEELRELKALVSKIGTSAWWDKEIYQGEREISAGKFKVYKKASDLIADLHKGK